MFFPTGPPNFRSFFHSVEDQFLFTFTLLIDAAFTDLGKLSDIFHRRPDITLLLKNDFRLFCNQCLRLLTFTSWTIHEQTPLLENNHIKLIVRFNNSMILIYFKNKNRLSLITGSDNRSIGLVGDWDGLLDTVWFIPLPGTDC